MVPEGTRTEPLVEDLVLILTVRPLTNRLLWPAQSLHILISQPLYRYLSE